MNTNYDIIRQVYELRISVGNEYRAILFTIDQENFVQAEQILLLNIYWTRIMRKKIDIEKIQKLSTTEDMFQQEYGPKGTARREEFEAKARAWYYAEVLRYARKAAGMTQQQLADKIGKKREYVALLEKGETDMQLSTFLMISDAVGLKFGLTM